MKNFKKLGFDFSINENGRIESLKPYGGKKRECCIVLLRILMERKQIRMDGLRSEGFITSTNDVVTIDYDVVTNLTDDLDEEVENVRFEIPLTELPSTY